MRKTDGSEHESFKDKAPMKQLRGQSLLKIRPLQVEPAPNRVFLVNLPRALP